MSPFRVFVGLGSNLGERHTLLSRAANAMTKVPSTRIVWCSSVYETDPVGNTMQPKFLNAVAELESSLRPEELITHLQRIEAEVGRTPTERWGPREIDLDILLYDGVAFSNDVVTVPHPELEHRRFALVPLREIAPDVIHPVSGLTVKELAAACSEEGRIVKSSYRINY